MANKFYDKRNAGQGGSNKAMGASPSASMPERTANWPGVPGKTQKSRAGGAPKTGHCGPFYVKSEGI